MDTFWMEVLKLLLRAGARLLAGALVTYGILTPGQFDWFVVGLVTAVAGLVWSLWLNYRDRLHFLTALELPAGATVADVRRAARRDPPALRSIVLPLLIAAWAASSGCASARPFVPGTTPSQQLAYEMREAIARLRAVQETLIQAAEQGRVTIDAVDPYLVPAKEIFVFTRDRVTPALVAFDEAWRLGDATRIAASRETLAPQLAEWNALATRLFGARLPSGLLEPLTTLADEVRTSLRMTRAEFRAQLTF